MSFPSGMAKATVNAAPSKSAGTLLHGQRRVLVSAGVAAVAILSLGTFLIRLPAFMIHVQPAHVSLWLFQPERHTEER
jgi:hypothetical protein